MRALVVMVCGLFACTRQELDAIGTRCLQTDFCEGDLVRHCDVVCPANDCQRELTTVADCTEESAMLGVNRSCEELLRAVNSDDEFPACVDEGAPACTMVGAVQCTPLGLHLLAACTDSSKGPILNSFDRCPDDGLCRADDFGTGFCHAANAPSCTAGTPPTCTDATTLSSCRGNPTDGHVLVTTACQIGCSSASGQADCE